jgi:hypothetical protein
MAVELVSKAKCYNGYQKVYKHFSKELNCSMNFSLYEPVSSDSEKLHALLFRSILCLSFRSDLHGTELHPEIWRPEICF